jgi:hypothetical protein
VVGRKAIKWDSNADEDGFIPDGSSAAGDGTFLEEQPVVQHNGELGNGFRILNATYEGDYLDPGSEYVDSNSPKDMVTARPGEVTFIKAKFDKPGRYVWHCHILSHEDHEMMRILHVGPEGKSKDKSDDKSEDKSDKKSKDKSKDSSEDRSRGRSRDK